MSSTFSIDGSAKLEILYIKMDVYIKVNKAPIPKTSWIGLFVIRLSNNPDQYVQ